jgi:hypothetical protein
MPFAHDEEDTGQPPPRLRAALTDRERVISLPGNDRYDSFHPNFYNFLLTDAMEEVKKLATKPVIPATNLSQPGAAEVLHHCKRFRRVASAQTSRLIPTAAQ